MNTPSFLVLACLALLAVLFTVINRSPLSFDNAAFAMAGVERPDRWQSVKTTLAKGWQAVKDAAGRMEAKVQFGSGVAGISGRTAGTVFARNKGGAYMRRFSVPTNPRTQSQEEARQRLSDQSSAWRTLNQDQRDSWNAWAQEHPILDRLGASILLTGHQAFVKVNSNVVLFTGGAPLTAPPANPVFKVPAISQTAAFDATVADSIILLAGVDLVIGDRIAIWMSPPVSPGVSNTFSKERLVTTLTLAADVDAGDELPDIGPAYVAVFGTLTGKADQKIIARAYFYSNGQLSGAVQNYAIVA